MEDFIASNAFDEAVLRAAKRGVELAMAQEEVVRAKAASTAAGG